MRYETFMINIIIEQKIFRNKKKYPNNGLTLP